jgi:hypothetical protein
LFLAGIAGEVFGKTSFLCAAAFGFHRIRVW